MSIEIKSAISVAWPSCGDVYRESFSTFEELVKQTEYYNFAFRFHDGCGEIVEAFIDGRKLNAIELAELNRAVNVAVSLMKSERN